MARIALFALTVPVCTQCNERYGKQMEATVSPVVRTMLNEEEDPIKGFLSALQVFGVSQPTPLVFGLLDAYYRNKLSLKQVKDTIWAIECFHFTYTAIASQSSSGEISFMYAAAA